MTTLIEDLGLPYGVTIEGDGTWFPKIVGSHPMKGSPTLLKLMPGPCRVAFSWDGANAVDLVLKTGSTSKRVASIPSRSQRGAVGSTMVTIGARAGDQVELNVNSAVGETGTIEVYPMPS